MKEHKRQFVADIIDLFEDWLDEKGIKIPNDEREPDNETNIYGDDFSYLMDGVINILEAEGIKVAENYN